MCTDIYLCQTCFNGPSHIQHRFHYKEVCRLCYVTEYYCLYFAYNFCSTFSSRIILLKHTQLSKLRLKHSGLFFFPDMDLTLIKVYGVCSFKMCGIELHSVRCKKFVREKNFSCTKIVQGGLSSFCASLLQKILERVTGTIFWLGGQNHERHILRKPPWIQLGGLRECCKLPSGVWSGAPTEIEFDAF